MGAQAIGILAILVVVIFSVYIAAGGITGLFVGAPKPGTGSEGAVPELAANATKEIPEENETAEEFPEEETASQEEPADFCKGVACPSNNKTCPDKAVVSCLNTCDPLTGKCSSCSPDCSGHQATSSGGGGGGGWSPPAAEESPPPCTDTSWTIQGDWSECSPEGKQTATSRSNCGRTRTETRGCAHIWVSPEAQSANITDNITVSVKINATAGIYAFDFKLHFDKDILNATQALEGDFLKGGGAQTFPVINIDSTNGIIKFASTRFETNSSASGEGILVTINFSPLKSGTSQLSFVEVQITNPNLQQVNHSSSGGAIEVSGA